MVDTTTESARPPRGRRILFRVLALLLGLAPFVLGEAVCRWAHWGRPQGTRDPYVGFAGVEPLFVLDASGERYEIPASRQAFFAADSFAARKPANGFRIFCLGGSTVQGRPYSNETAFTTWLRLGLESADQGRAWEVINCGGVSYASYRLVPILQEVLRYEPDLVVVYTGHNEFLEERTYGHLKRTPRWVSDTYRVLHRSRLFSAAWQAWHGAAGERDSEGRPLLPAEVDALLDYRGGLERYRRDDAWREAVMRHYEWNLHRMADLCREAGVPLVLVNPVSNLKDCPPFKIVPNTALSAEQQEAFEQLWQQARKPELSTERREELLRRALEIDPRHAGAHFLLGKAYEAAGRDEQALAEFLRAKDQDACPLRMLEPMHDILRHVAREHDLELVDVRQRITRESPQHLVGDEWMLDHVHPSIRGHQLIADMLLEVLARGGDVQRTPGWEARRGALYRRHLGTLPTAYFARGKERLEGLRRWTEGRVNKLRREDDQ